MTNKLTDLIAAGLLAAMGVLAFASLANDTLTFDEVAHIGAGYTYWNNQDYRMNPEHPPLVKDLAGLPLMFLHLNFPAAEYWENAAPYPWWTQFDFGDQLLYHAGNDPDKIMLFARIGPIMLLLLMGGFLFFWARKLVGNGWALFLLAIFAFCPNFLANGRLVTTDVGASFGALFATYFWLNFIKNPNWKNTVGAGIAFGVAMLIKFSLILLVPFFSVITIVWALWQNGAKARIVWTYCWRSVAAALIGVIFIIGPVYAWHIAKYPYEKQLSDTKNVLATTSLPQWMQNINIGMAQQPLLRPWAQYLLGLGMATNRTGTGNTTYFEGSVSTAGRRDYFPTLYLVKIPLAFHIMTLIVLAGAVILLARKKFRRSFAANLKESILNNYDIFTMVVFLAIYWAASLIGSLNIGLRHILPTFAFTYLLVVIGLKNLANRINNSRTQKTFKLTLGILLGWFILSALAIFPYYLAYYNELAGGPDNGYKIAVDSNLDWGQDLKRLNKWILDINDCYATFDQTTSKDYDYIGGDCFTLAWVSAPIRTIYVDYFGGGDPEYYLGNKYIKWTSDMDPSQIPPGSLLAVSANQMMGQRAQAAPGYNQPTNKYDWLDQYEPPYIKIGYSIFIYQID